VAAGSFMLNPQSWKKASTLVRVLQALSEGSSSEKSPGQIKKLRQETRNSAPDCFTRGLFQYNVSTRLLCLSRLIFLSFQLILNRPPFHLSQA